ncbi:class I SAM-dependent methyltransferase [Methylobacterium sp. 13MFTsu3.1M2]|uniref:class I SAM-dependent methyltransferase n=1 Tax=Methylobacterium sp. 13MFTsu3.1M2 TaxID=1502776 RepID=UPI0008E247FA|nr:class I SAM-dependent methyltransferase [Methylobacterium sp. 13MFTsu3.1M2]SFF06646.1 Methyltransferase domain-containing protein [Methylobacterium sp. 13MFTsu3.1M2]
MERKSRHFRTFADDMKQFADFSNVADRDPDGRTPFLPNGYFNYGDALALTTVLATRKPARYVEVGGGNSTKFARRAIGKYKLDTKIECLDPNPRSSVRDIADKWISNGLLDVDPSYFQSLKDGDVLMLDGSHFLFHGADTTHFFLRIYPLLRPGVIVHVHDIHLPYKYPEICDTLFSNEQYILAMIFYYKPASEIITPIKYMHREGMCDEGASFWFEV